MDIDKLNFPSKLLEILEAIAESDFVSLDLELSGVPVRPFGSVAAHKGQEPSLQERYLEVKIAAEKYQILQIGITCAKRDKVEDKYILRPFNIPLSPIIEERLDVDRDFTFHTGAVEFLLGVDFDFHIPFKWGVPYLSRDEARLALKRAIERAGRDKDAYADIEVQEDDLEAHRVVGLARTLIHAWVENDGTMLQDQLFLGPKKLYNCGVRAAEQDLSRYDKRLVHQLVRAEFKDLATVSKRGGIIILVPDEERERSIKEQRLREVKERIARQIGFRWVIEALTGGDLSAIDLKTFTRDPITGDPRFMDMNELHNRFQRARSLLHHRPRVIVGHNVFLDLVYAYSAFVGALPDTVEEFQVAVHALFPLAIDTKYLATHHGGHVGYPSSLQQLFEQLESQDRPAMVTHSDHLKYDKHDAYHEAGFDSLLTA